MKKVLKVFMLMCLTCSLVACNNKKVKVLTIHFESLDKLINGKISDERLKMFDKLDSVFKVKVNLDFNKDQDLDKIEIISIIDKQKFIDSYKDYMIKQLDKKNKAYKKIKNYIESMDDKKLVEKMKDNKNNSYKVVVDNKSEDVIYYYKIYEKQQLDNLVHQNQFFKGMKELKVDEIESKIKEEIKAKKVDKNIYKIEREYY